MLRGAERARRPTSPDPYKQPKFILSKTALLFGFCHFFHLHNGSLETVYFQFYYIVFNATLSNYHFIISGVTQTYKHTLTDNIFSRHCQ